MKNIVICCDGTENKLTINENTNVLHLFSCLKQDEKQVAYYNPGVGTIWQKKNRKRFKIIDKKLDSISGASLTESVLDAYRYLMDIYEEGDLVFVFGFSRGAYCVRMLCGMIEMYGLLYRGNVNHLRYLLNIYYANDLEKWELANKFKKRFSRTIKIHFMGIWDTVVSMGNPFSSYDNYPYTNQLNIVDNIRHAIAIDERRKHFRVNRIDIRGLKRKEVWFAGVHSDIGGSYREEGLSKISLQWMLGEASHLGLSLDKKSIERYVLGINDQYQSSNFMAKTHNSLLHNLGWLVDFIPRKRSKVKSKGGKNVLSYYYDTSIWPIRKIEKGDNIHVSVNQKIEQDQEYNPKNVSGELELKEIQDVSIIYQR